MLTSVVPAALGVASHVLYFNKGEHHLYAALYARILFFSTVLVVFVFAFLGGEAKVVATRAVATAGWYFAGFYSSLLTYRVFLHPLRSFPGPLGAKISSLWLPTQVFGSSQAYRKVLDIHRRYGDFVRIGSSDLAICHPEAVSAIYGRTSRCTKGAWYDLTYPMISLQTTRDREAHQRQRRLWSGAFSDKQLRGYEERIDIFRRKLVDRISRSARDGTPLDVTQWFNLFTFDVMGDLAFGAPFDMLDSSEQHWAIRILKEGVKPLSLHLPVWLFQVLTSIPGAANDWWKFIRYCCEKLDERISAKQGEGNSDIMSVLLTPWKGKEISREGRKLLEGDSQLIIVAGSDTTAATMTHVLYQLVKNPDQLHKLQEELAPYFTNGIVDYHTIQNLQHLNGIINETLRLHPPVPTALHRLTPPEGITVGGRHIPGGMTVWASQYVLGRSERIYPRANEFVPERWSTMPELVLDKTAFSPFSAGAYACIGKSLAMQNMRNTLAEIVLRFDIGKGPNHDVELFEEGTKEQFTLDLPSLNLLFKERAN